MIVNVPNAIAMLNAGSVVGIPTETVYGLAARIDRPEGILKIFETKERPFFDPLIVHVSDIDQARNLALEWSPTAEALAQFFWPGPLTLVVPKNPDVSSMISSGLETVGIRCPWHKVALEIIKATGPLAAPSANKFGRTSPTSADDVEEEFHHLVPVVDGGPCEVGVESTILALEGNRLRILRPGLILPSQIREFLKSIDEAILLEEGELAKTTHRSVASPGNLKHHYMPAIPLVLAMRKLPHQEILEKTALAFLKLPEEIEGVRLLKPAQVRSFAELMLSQDPRIAAREVYSHLRALSRNPVDFILLEWRPEWSSEDWSPIIDRLKKAASCILL